MQALSVKQDDNGWYETRFYSGQGVVAWANASHTLTLFEANLANKKSNIIGSFFCKKKLLKMVPSSTLRLKLSTGS